MIFIDRHIHLCVELARVVMVEDMRALQTNRSMQQQHGTAALQVAHHTETRECNFLPKSNFYGPLCCRYISVVFVQKD